MIELPLVSVRYAPEEF
jgi:hypothetical protein